MIDLAQAAALVVQPPDLSSFAHLVRIISALAGDVMVFATFMLARLVLPASSSLATAAPRRRRALRRSCPHLQRGHLRLRPSSCYARSPRPYGALRRRAGAAHAAHADRGLRAPVVRRARGAAQAVDFARYMLPLVPLLLILGASFVYELAARWDRRGVLAEIVLVLAAVPTLVMLVRINSPDVESRSVVTAIGATSGARVIFDRYSDYERNGRILCICFRPTKNLAASWSRQISPMIGPHWTLRQSGWQPIIASSRHIPISMGRMSGRRWPTSIPWCALLPWT